MSAQNNGGPAFPSMVEDKYGESEWKGMTLRDYFAAHAPEVPDLYPVKQWTKVEIIPLGGGMKGPRDVMHQETWAERSARWAIEYADAMLAERAK